MNSVTYKSVLDRIAGYLAEADGLSAEDVALATAKVNLFVRLGWQHYWWPDTMAIERRTFRPAWNSTTAYATGTQVFFNADGQYYQAMQPSTGQAPSILTSGAYAPNYAYWFPCQASYCGSDLSTTQIYAVSNIVRNPADGLFYGLYRLTYGVTVTSAGLAAANGEYVWDGSQYTAPNGYTIKQVILTDSITHAQTANWFLKDANGTFLYSPVASAQFPFPAVNGVWTTAYDVSYGTPPNVALTDPITDQPAPFTSAYWTVLTPFVRSLDYTQSGQTAIGMMRFIWDRDPELDRRAQTVAFTNRPAFYQVYGCVNIIYPEFQLRVPVFSSVVRDDTASYGAGVTLYDAATGDCWTTLEAVSPGESPTSAPSSWSKVEFPYVLAEYVAQSVHAMLTDREQETPENFAVQNSAGYPLLLAEIDNLERKQGQTRQLNVKHGSRGVGMSPYSW